MEALLAQILARLNHILEVVREIRSAPIVSVPIAFQTRCPHCGGDLSINTVVRDTCGCGQLLKHAHHTDPTHV